MRKEKRNENVHRDTLTVEGGFAKSRIDLTERLFVGFGCKKSLSDLWSRKHLSKREPSQAFQQFRNPTVQNPRKNDSVLNPQTCSPGRPRSYRDHCPSPVSRRPVPCLYWATALVFSARSTQSSTSPPRSGFPPHCRGPPYSIASTAQLT